MPIVHSVRHDLRHVEAVATGPIGWGEIRAHLIAERHEGGLSYPELIDARGATPTWSAVQTGEIVKLVKTLKRASPFGPTAVVVSTDVAFGMVRMLQILLEGECAVRPFRDYEAAEAWLREQRERRPGSPV